MDPNEFDDHLAFTGNFTVGNDREAVLFARLDRALDVIRDRQLVKRGSRDAYYFNTNFIATSLAEREQQEIGILYWKELTELQDLEVKLSTRIMEMKAHNTGQVQELGELQIQYDTLIESRPSASNDETLKPRQIDEEYKGMVDHVLSNLPLGYNDAKLHAAQITQSEEERKSRSPDETPPPPPTFEQAFRNMFTPETAREELLFRHLTAACNQLSELYGSKYSVKQVEEEEELVDDDNDDGEDNIRRIQSAQRAIMKDIVSVNESLRGMFAIIRGLDVDRQENEIKMKKLVNAFDALERHLVVVAAEEESTSVPEVKDTPDEEEKHADDNNPIPPSPTSITS